MAMYLANHNQISINKSGIKVQRKLIYTMNTNAKQITTVTEKHASIISQIRAKYNIC